MPPSRHGFPREAGHDFLAALELLAGFRETVDVHVGVADVAEDDVAAGRFFIHHAAVNRHHFAILVERHRVIGSELHESGAADAVVGFLGEGVAEGAEALAVGGGGGEPGVISSARRSCLCRRRLRSRS